MSASHNYYVSILCEAPIETKTKQQKWWEFVAVGKNLRCFRMVKASKSYCSKHLKQKLRQEERKLNKRKMIALEKVSIFRKQKLSKTKIKVAKFAKNSQPTNGYFKQNYNGIGFKLRCYLY